MTSESHPPGFFGTIVEFDNERLWKWLEGQEKLYPILQILKIEITFH